MFSLLTKMIFVTCLICFFDSVETCGQTNQSLLDMPIEEFSIETKSIQSVLSNLAVTHKVPIGLEIDNESNNAYAPTIKIDVEKSSLRKVLDLIVNAFPKYKWEVIDNVVNISPKTSQDEILEIRVKAFSFREDNIYELTKAITQIPEVKEKTRAMNLKFVNLALSSSDFKNPSKNFSIEVDNVSLRSILNLVIVNSRKHFWVFSRIGDNNEFLTINF